MNANQKDDERNFSGLALGSSASPNGVYANNNVNYNPVNNAFGRPGSRDGAPAAAESSQIPSKEATAEEKQQRLEERADWEAARHSQNPLWDMFLYGGILNDRIRQISLREHLTDPQHGVLVNTQKTGPPPVARVNGQKGASRVIDKGQAILDMHKGDRLGEIMKLVTLATKSRLTGLLSASARLAMERREHSKGRVPIEWQDVAVAAITSAERGTTIGAGDAENATANPLKRTHDQANSANGSQRAASSGPENKAISVLSNMMQDEKGAEEARRIKRTKRKAVADAANQAAQTAAEEEAVAAVNNEPAKKTKKAEKQENARAVEAQQHQQANAAAQLAMSSMLGGRKGKSYSWMKSGGSGASTPSRLGLASAAGTPKSVERTKPVVKERGFGAWDEDKHPGIQARDVLHVLETDNKAPRAYTKGCVMLDG